MPELFDTVRMQREPLAARMRPRNLDEYIGQDHIVGKGRLLRRAIAADQLSSVIFYGPPGSGKTTLARVIANHTKSNFITLNAVLSGIAEIRGAIKQAEEYFKLYSRRTILFVDEVHRWNKAQQDALLPWVENGTVILIGATTENPFFEVNKALVSRSRVFQLKPLTKEDLLKAANQALADTERGYGRWHVEFEKGALEHLVDTANGDARSLLNALELAVETTPERWEPNSNPPVPAPGSTIYISRDTAEESIQKKVVLYDRDGDYHYDIISAFIKSLRGRDPDAAMYWLARMVRAGEDPDFIFRRMLISACEDTGLADPYAISVVTSCAEAFDRVGLPEGRYHLAHAALYLATAPKSNSSMAFFDALSSVEKEDADVPNHLKDANRDSEGFGHGAGYLYPHAYRDHWVAQQYLPDALVGRVFYNPSSQGYEAKIREDVLSRRELQISAILENTSPSYDGHTPMAEGESAVTGSRNYMGNEGKDWRKKSEFGASPLSQWWINAHFKGSSKSAAENLTFSPKDDRKESALDKADKSWRSRLDSNRAEVLLSIRQAMVNLGDLSRHDRSLIWNCDDGLLLWEVARKTPEGVTCGVCRSAKGKEIIEQYGRTLGDLDKPMLLLRPQGPESFLHPEDFLDVLNTFGYKGTIFDKVFFRDPFASREAVSALVKAFSAAVTASENPLAEGWKLVISQRIPAKGQKISDLITGQIVKETADTELSSILGKMKEADNEFFTDKENPLFNWDGSFIENEFKKAGFSVTWAGKILEEKRRITPPEISRWFDAGTSAYGSYLAEKVGGEAVKKIANLLNVAAGRQIFNWQSEIALFTVGR